MRAASLLAFLLLLLVPAARAQQAAFAGRVTDAETGQPLPGAHVFIATSMTGTVTDDDGRYRLDGLPLGAHRLYVSMLGYAPEGRDLMLRQPRLHTQDVALQPEVIEVGEVTVTADGDPRWKDRLEKFTRLFIGTSPNAAQVTILNPEVLDFNAGGEFRALAAAPLVIENRALGYRLTYFLREFAATTHRTRYDGEPLYEALTPESPAQAEAWAEARKTAFYGSFRHFMLATLTDRLDDHGFHVFHRPAAVGGPQTTGLGGGALAGRQRFPIAVHDFLHDGETPGEHRLDWPGFLEIVYSGEEEHPSFLVWQGRSGRPKFQTSQLQLERGPTTVDRKGDVLDPYGVTFSGYLAFERVADALPKEYRPW